MFDEHHQYKGARAAVRSQQSLCLGRRQAESWHFAVLTLDSRKQLANRRWRAQLNVAGCPLYFSQPGPSGSLDVLDCAVTASRGRE